MKIEPKKIGSKAPQFSLQNQKGKKISLKDFKDKKNVVVYFYPRALTPGCTVQACAIRDSKKEFAKLDTVVLGVSTDAIEKLERFEDKKDLNFDLLSDENHKIAEIYGVWGDKKFMGKSYQGLHRMTFIINKAGKIVHVIKKVKTKTHHDDVMKIIKEIL